MNQEKEFINNITAYINRVHENVVAINNDPKDHRQGNDLSLLVFRALHKSKNLNLDFPINLMKLITEEHPFIEGNKRTAYIVGKSLLFFSGDLLLCITKERAEKFMRMVAIRCEKENPKDLSEIKKFIIDSSKGFPIKLLDNPKKLNVFLKEQPQIRRETIIKYLRRLSLELNNGR